MDATVDVEELLAQVGRFMRRYGDESQFPQGLSDAEKLLLYCARVIHERVETDRLLAAVRQTRA